MTQHRVAETTRRGMLAGVGLGGLVGPLAGCSGGSARTASATASSGGGAAPCHGSRFSVTDGHVVAGPAPSPPPAQSLKIQSDQISLA